MEIFSKLQSVSEALTDPDYFINDQRLQSVDKTLDREVGDDLFNCVRTFYVTAPKIGLTITNLN